VLHRRLLSFVFFSEHAFSERVPAPVTDEWEHSTKWVPGAFYDLKPIDLTIADAGTRTYVLERCEDREARVGCTRVELQNMRSGSVSEHGTGVVRLDQMGIRRVTRLKTD
jgi:hypothetical protein